MLAGAAFVMPAAAQTVITNGTILNGAAESGNYTVNSGSNFTAENGTVFSGGTTTLANCYVYLSGTGTALTIASDAIWTGNLTIYGTAANLALVNDGSITNSSGGNNIYGGNYAGFTFTNNGTVGAAGGTLNVGNGGNDSVVNSSTGVIESNGGYVTVGNGASVTVVNAGTLEAIGATGSLTLGSTSATWTNTGTIEALSGGTVNLGGLFSTANLTSGTINGTAGTINITGTLNNSLATLNAPDGGGIFTLDGGTITGGTVNGTALAFGPAGGSTLNGATMSGNFAVPSGANFTAKGNTLFTGGTTSIVNNYVYLSGTGTALTVAPGATLSGNFTIYALAAGLSAVNNGTMTVTAGGNNFYGGNYAGFTFTNNGTVGATGGTLNVGNGGNDSVVNSSTGVIESNGGYVTVGNGASVTVANAGTLEAIGATGSLTLGSTSATWTNTGTIEALSGGTVNLGGLFSTANLTSGAINGTAGTINITGTLNNSLATLNAPNAGGIFTLDGGTISGGTVNGTALTFGPAGGSTLDGVTMSGNFTAPSGANFTSKNNTLFTGGTTSIVNNYIYLSGTGPALTVAPGATLSGNFTIYALAAGLSAVNNGTMTVTAGGNNFYGGNYAGFTFTNNGTVNATGGNLYIGNGGTDTIVNSSTGVIQANGGTLTVGNGSSVTVVNAGTLEATSPTGSLTLGSGGSTWVNTGTITASGGGTVDFGGTFATANLAGVINGLGGTLNLTGTLLNLSSTLMAPTSGIYTLFGGTVSNGTVSGNALTFSNNGGTLDGATMSGNFSLPSNLYAQFTAKNNAQFTGGTTTFTSPGYDSVSLNGTGTALTIAPSGVWTGSVSVTGQNSNVAFVNQGTINLTAGSNSIWGNNSGFTFNNTGSLNVTSGTTYLGNYSNDVITNGVGGSMTVSGAGAFLDLGYSQASWSNQGSLLATNNGAITFGGNYTTADFGGTIDSNTGGALNLVGQMNNAAATLVPPHTGIYTLYGATISGGTVASGALTFSNNGGALSGVTMSGNFSLPSNLYAQFTAKNNTQFTGGTTSFTSPGYDTVYLNGTGTALTIAPSGVWTGSVSITGQNSNVAFVNQGTINLTAGSNSIWGNNSGFTFNNTGSLNVTLGTTNLGNYLNDVITNGVGGSMTASGTGAFLDLGYSQASWSNQGSLLAANNGVITFGGNYTTADFGGTIDSNTGGALNLVGQLNNAAATLVPPHTGIYTLYGATITGGTVASGALTFSNNGGALSGVTMSGNFSLPAAAYTNFSVNSNTTFTGGTTTFAPTGGYDTIYLGGTGTALNIAPSAMWTGSFSVASQATNLTLLNQGTLNYTAGSDTMYGNSNGFTFTNTGSVTVGSGANLTLGIYSNDTITNALGGTMTANGGTIYMGYNLAAWHNLGSLLATNGGTIDFESSYLTSDLGGTIDSNTGGALNLEGQLNNAAATLNPPHSGVYTLYGATISGGTVASGALTFGNNGGTLSGVAMSGNFSLPAAAYANFHITNGTTFSGGTTTFAPTGGYDTVYLNGTGTALTLAPSAVWTGSFNVNAQATNLTFANQGTMNYSTGTSYIEGNNAGFTFQNTGAITAGSGATLYLGYYSNDSVSNGSGAFVTANGGTVVLGNSLSPWANLGTLDATNNGIIDFLGNYTTAALGGAIESSAGGVLNLEGTLNNAASTLNAPVTGAYTLDGATITGGTVGSGALTFGGTGGTLSGVTMTGNFSLPASSYATFYSNSGTTFTGGTTAFATISYDAVYLGSGTGAALTLAPTATWSGDFDIYGTAAGLSIINQGTMSLPGSGGYSIESQSSLDGLSITNSGLMVTNGATLYLGLYANDSFTNQPGGTLEANGGAIFVDYNLATSPNLASNTLTGGTWEAASGGILAFYGTSNAIGTNAATIILSGPGSTIETRSGAGPSYQTLEQTLATNNGTLEVLANRNFASTSAGITNNGTIQLGGGTLTAASLTNGSGSTLSGYGTFGPTGGVTIGSGVLLSPGPSNTGNYVGALTFSTPLTFGQGGATTFDIENASGAAGTGYDTINVTGTLTVSATSGSPFTINIESINPGTGLPGLATFNMAQSYQWTLASAGSVSGFNASDFNFNVGSFANGLGTGYFSVSSSATDIFLNFTPVPEPSTWALIAAGAAMAALASRRRSGAKPAPTR